MTLTVKPPKVEVTVPNVESSCAGGSSIKTKLEVVLLVPKKFVTVTVNLMYFPASSLVNMYVSRSASGISVNVFSFV